MTPSLAEQRLRAAVSHFERLDLPFPAARTRLDLARVVADSDPSLAIVEAEPGPRPAGAARGRTRSRGDGGVPARVGRRDQAGTA